MKLSTIILSLLILLGCKGKKRETSFEINPSAKDSFYFAQTHIDTSKGLKSLLIDGYTAIFVPEKTLTGENMVWGEQSFAMPCQCAFQKDTLIIISALAWEGGFAYIAKATRTNVTNSLKLFGKDRKWKLNEREYKDKIEIPSATHKLILSKNLPLKEGEFIYGRFDIQIPEFFEVKGTKKEKEIHGLKIYFSCIVQPTIS